MIALRYVPIDRRKYPLARRRKERFPLERLTILAFLDDQTLYGPAEVAAVGYAKGSAEYLRARRAFSYFIRENANPEGDDHGGKREGKTKVWFGASWKSAAGGRMHQVADLMAELHRRLREDPNMGFYLDNETLLSEKELTDAEAVKHLPSPPTQDTPILPVTPRAPVQPPKWHKRSLLVAILMILVLLGLLTW